MPAWRGSSTRHGDRSFQDGRLGAETRLDSVTRRPRSTSCSDALKTVLNTPSFLDTGRGTTSTIDELLEARDGAWPVEKRIVVAGVHRPSVSRSGTSA